MYERLIISKVLQQLLKPHLTSIVMGYGQRMLGQVMVAKKYKYFCIYNTSYNRKQPES